MAGEKLVGLVVGNEAGGTGLEHQFSRPFDS